MATVQRSPESGISVLISGAGVGGLMAALECWRRGSDVRIFERTKTNATHGDSFTLGSSALNSFKNWPEMDKRCEEIAYKPLLAIHNQTGERMKGPMELTTLLSNTVDQTKFRLGRHSRPAFHAMLLEQLSKVGLDVEYGREVTDYFEDASTGKGGIVLKDGSKYTADLVVAADGNRTTSWPLVAGAPIPARSSGNAAFRIAYPVEIALADPMIAERFPLTDDGRSVIETWTGSGFTGLFWRNEDTMNIGINHPDTGSAEESWGKQVGPEEVLKFTATIPGWPEVADRVIKAIPDGLVDWKLMWRDPKPKWTSPAGHVVQLGDTAHTFLPSSGNGGTQAIEDPISLATCLNIAGKDNIPDAVRVHNLLRFERVSFLQAFGILNREARTNDKISSEKKNVVPTVGKWLIEHDPEQYAVENYKKALEHLVDGTPFQNTNRPTGVEYRPWTIDNLVEALEKGEPSILDGDWT